MIFKTTFYEGLFRAISPKISHKFIVFVPKLHIIRDFILALHFYEKYKIIMNQELVI